MISLVDGIFHIENGENRHRDRFAVLDGHRTIARLGHDLQRHAVLVHHPGTNETIIHGEENRLDDLGNPEIDSVFDDDARLVFGLRHRLFRQCLLRRGLHRPPNKKERVPVRPHPSSNDQEYELNIRAAIWICKSGQSGEQGWLPRKAALYFEHNSNLPSGNSVPDRQSPFAPLRHDTYRSMWTASLASNLGGLIQAVGAAWLMTALTTSENQIGRASCRERVCQYG